MKWAFILALCIILFVVHIFAAVALAKTRKLRKNGFFKLAFLLIINDAYLMIVYAWHTIAMNTNDYKTRGAHQVQCLVMIHFIPASIQYSLLITILMCLQRLNATFRTPNQMLNLLTSNIAIGLGFLLSHSYFFVRGVLEFLDNIQHEDLPCGPKYKAQKRFLLFVDAPNALLVAVIALCYVVVMLRIIRNRRQVNVFGNLTNLQLQQKNRAAFRMHNNMIIFSCIIIVTAISILPRSLYGLYANFTDTINDDIVRATNNLLLLNPLVDPFIYIFIIKEVRSKLICNLCQPNHTAPTTKAIQLVISVTPCGISDVPTTCIS